MAAVAVGHEQVSRLDARILRNALPYMTDDLGLTPVTEGMVTSSLLLAVVCFLATLGCRFAPNTETMTNAPVRRRRRPPGVRR